MVSITWCKLQVCLVSRNNCLISNHQVTKYERKKSWASGWGKERDQGSGKHTGEFFRRKHPMLTNQLMLSCMPTFYAFLHWHWHWHTIYLFLCLCLNISFFITFLLAISLSINLLPNLLGSVSGDNVLMFKLVHANFRD